METLQTINAISTRSHFRFRSILIIAGIVIAVICSLVSLTGNEGLTSDSTMQSSRSLPTPSLSGIKTAVVGVVGIVKSDVLN